MNKKQKTALFIGLLILLNCIVSTSSIAFGAQDEKVTSTDDDNSYHLVMTKGPAWLKIFTKIDIIDGDAEQVSELTQYLKRKKLPDKVQPFFVEELTFKVTYRLPVTIFSRFSYYTANTTDVDIDRLDEPDYIKYLIQVIKNLDNYSQLKRNRRHTVTFENFTGAFLLQKGKLIRFLPPKFFIPAKFIAVGICEKIIKN